MPDRRQPVFTVPDWVELPEVLRPHLEARRANGLGDFPFLVEQAVHFSNAGGVYLARHRETGESVVLREARPHAGLDARGRDGVTRLMRERDALCKLDGLDCVPRLIDYLEAGGHHFLVLERVAGDTLMTAMFNRYPLVRPGTGKHDLAEYSAWVRSVVWSVRDALRSVHERGLRHGDLQPSNIMLTPDGRVVLLDFELASTHDDQAHPGLAAPGFNRAARISGPDGDWEALLILWLYLLFPMVDVIDRDPDKFGVLIEAALRFFPDAQRDLPVELAARLPQSPARPQGRPERFFKEHADPGETCKSICAAIYASASPERDDRLFPADPSVFHYGGHTLAYGAAGVLWALHQSGQPIADSHIDWLVRSALAPRTGGFGLYNGQYGAAVVLDTIGRRQEGLDVLAAARSGRQPVSPGLFGGRAGVGLALLHFAEMFADDELRVAAIALADGLANDLRAGRFEQCDASVMYGMSGVALLFLHAYRSTRAERYLDFAMTALRADLNKCVTAQGDALMVLEGHRHVPAFEHGSAGIALIAHEFLRWREDDLLRADLDGLLRACAVPFTREPGLFRGRAGLIVALAGTGQATAAAHAARFAWHAMPFHGHLAFPGSHLRRLSMDLATGSAGVLLALLAASEKGHVLPFTDTRYPVANGSTFILEGGDSHGIGPGLPGARPGATARQLL